MRTACRINELRNAHVKLVGEFSPIIRTTKQLDALLPELEVQDRIEM